MPNQKKIFTVANLTQKIKDAKSLILADYQGLSVAQINRLRDQIKAVGGEFEVVKNRLLKIASDEAKIELDDQVLTGPTAILWAWENELEAIKTLENFAKENNSPKIKSGLFEGKIISAEKIKQLAQIPGKKELQAKLVGALCSPAYGLVNSLSWNLKKLVYVLSEKAKGGEDHGWSKHPT